MQIGVINKIFLTSQPREQQQEPCKAGAFNLLWSVADSEADSCLGEHQPSSTSGATSGSNSGNIGRGGDGDGGHTVDTSGTVGSGGIDWRKGAYAVRFKGSEFVTTKALAHGGATGSGDAKSSRYDKRAGRSDVDAAMEPFQQPGAADGEAGDAAGGGGGGTDGPHPQAATMWIAGPEAQAMEHRSQVPTLLCSPR